MLCEGCRKREAEVSFRYSRKLCRLCFSKALERRCRNDLAYSGAIDRIIGARAVVLLDDGTLESEAARIFLSKIITDKRVKFIIRKCRKPDSSIFEDRDEIDFAKKKSSKCIAVPWSIEREDALFLESQISGKKKRIGAVQKENGIIFIKIFRNATRNEMREYAKRLSKRKLSGEERSPVYRMTESLEKKYPGIKFSILSSANFLQKISGKNRQE